MSKNEDDVLRTALTVLIDSIETPLTTGLHNAEAVVAILCGIHVSQAIVDFVAERYLEIYIKSCEKHRFLNNNDALSVAVKIVKLGTSHEVTEKILRETAKIGWCEAAESMATQSLGRKLSKQEVLWLVDAYVRDTATQADHTEDELEKLAKKYLTPGMATKVTERLSRFKKDFNAFD